MTPRIEPMRPADWPTVRAIYEQGIATRLATFETNTPDWPEWDAARLPAPRLVARSGETIAGWAALSPVSRRPVYAGVAEVSVYVAADWRGHGVGAALLAALITGAEAAGIWTLQAVMFPENTASVALHRRHGFRLVGRRERIARLDGRWRDTVIYERRSAIVGMEDSG